MASEAQVSDDSGSPRSLLVFTAAALTVVAGVVLLAVTDSAWALIVAVCVLLLLLAVVLRELEAEISGREVPAAAGAPVAGAAPAAWRGPPARHRLLLVTSEPVSGSQLRAILAGEPRGGTAVLVVAPALDRGWLRYWVSDDDEGIARAGTVEEATVQALRRERVPAAGHVGAADPITAIEDALRFFDADRIFLALHRDGDRRYRERDLRAEVERRFGIPAYAIEPTSSIAATDDG